MFVAGGLIDFIDEQDAAQEALRQARAAGDFAPYHVRRRGWRWDVQYCWTSIGLTFWYRSTAVKVADELQRAARGKRPLST
jgi:hypothetical protein